MTGSSVASAAALGRIVIPELDRAGYPRSFSGGLLAAGGTLGIMIPPSIVFVIYGGHGSGLGHRYVQARVSCRVYSSPCF